MVCCMWSFCVATFTWANRLAPHAHSVEILVQHMHCWTVVKGRLVTQCRNDMAVLT